MRQINNDFASYYYLTEDGKVYNSKNNKYQKQDKSHCFRLIRKDNKTVRISLKKLYKLVYNENFCVDEIINLTGEIWKPIDRTNKTYWISNKGRVKSNKSYNSIILKPTFVNGYARVDIFQDESRSTKLISRLVAAAFLVPPAAIDMQLHHIDGDKSNNNADNLVWLTPKKHKEIHKQIEQERKEIEKCHNLQQHQINE